MIPPPVDLRELLELLRRRTGLEFRDSHHPLLVRKAQEQIMSRGSGSWRAYLEELRRDGASLAALVSTLTIKETSFFRHPEQFDYLAASFLPPRVLRARSTGRPLRLWSAACATGCEPYSLAILCAELEATRGAFPWEVLATDLDGSAVAVGARGRYHPRLVERSARRDRLARHLSGLPGGDFEVAAALRRRTRFSTLNLVADPFPAGCDAILLRNVLYYLDEQSQQRVLEGCARALAPGGILLVAPTDSLWELPGALEPLAEAPRALVRRARVPGPEPAVPPTGRSPAPFLGAVAPSRPPPPSASPPRSPPPPLPPGPDALIRFPVEADRRFVATLRTQLLPALDAALAGRCRRIVLDLSACRLVDEMVARTLARARRGLGADAVLVLERANPPVTRFLARYLAESDDRTG